MLVALQHLFTPHFSNDNRPRILQPVGLSILLGVFLLYQALIRLAFGVELPRGFVLGYASSINTAGVIETTNVERAKGGLPPLIHNSLLSQAAAAKAAHMFQHDYWAHVAPDGTTPWTFIKNTGYGYTVAGENLARDFGDTPAMMVAWMNSPTHRENIMHEMYTQIGVAVVNGTLQGVETTLVVQMFGKPSRAVAQVPAESFAASSEALAIKALPEKDTAPEPLPSVTLYPSPNPTETPTLNPFMAKAESVKPDDFMGATLSINSRADEGVLISPLVLSKALGTSMILMLLAVLLYDQWVVEKRKIPRSHGKNWAHATLFTVMLLLITVLSQGKVL